MCFLSRKMLVFEVKEESHLTYDRVFIGRSGVFVLLVHSHLERQQSRFYCILPDELHFGGDSQVTFHDAFTKACGAAVGLCACIGVSSSQNEV